MVDISALVDPTQDPGTYPGTPVPGSSVIIGDWMYPLSYSDGQWAVEVDGGPVTNGRHLLDDILATPMRERRPVLAIGSNASPAQVRRKWAGHEAAVPLIATEVTGIGIGYAACISRGGYVPYAPCHQTGQTRTLYTLWLNDSNIDHLNKTEPNYAPTNLSSKDYLAVLESGNVLRDFLIYRSRWGVLTDGEVLQAGTQQDVLAWLKGRLPHVVRAFQDGLTDETRTEARIALKPYATGDGLKTLDESGLMS